MCSAPPHRDPIRPGSLRSPTGRGRPYPGEIVVAVRALVEGTGLRFDEIAERTGICEATVGRWVRRFGWRRPGEGEVVAPGGGEPDAATRRGERNRGRYGAADHEAARALIEGSRLGLERIGLRLGIGTATLFRWQTRFGWSRPSPPDRPGPRYYRSRRLRGRPYAADAVETARRLVTGTLLPQARIAAQAGVSQASVSNWIARRGWTRPPAKPGSRRFAASRRTAPTAASGDRRGRRYDPQTVAAARDLYEQTTLSTTMIEARVEVSAVTLARWARLKGWTRPRDVPDPHGRRSQGERTRRFGLPFPA